MWRTRQNLFFPLLNALLFCRAPRYGGLLTGLFCGEVRDKKKSFFLRDLSQLYFRETKRNAPDMGNGDNFLFEQVSEFSTFRAGYPQEQVGYPQYRGTILQKLLFLFPISGCCLNNFRYFKPRFVNLFFEQFLKGVEEAV